MTHSNRILRTLIPAMSAVFLMAACGGDKPEALLASARDYLAKNDPKAAAIQVKNALQKNPNLGEGRYLLGKALLQSGDTVGAEVELRKAMDQKYSPDLTLPLLAQALLKGGQPGKVLSDLSNVQLTTPEAKADLQTSIALAEASLGQLDKAKTSLGAALAAKPDDARALIMKARLAVAEKNLPGALEILESVLAKDAKNYEAWKYKGDILNFQGNNDGALAAYRKGIEAKPDYAAAQVATISTLMGQKKLDEAGAQLEAMKKVLPKDPETLLIEVGFLYEKKDYKRALEVTQVLLKAAPDNPRVLLMAGAVQFQLNSLVQAEDFLSRALRRMPEAISARKMLAAIYLRTREPAKALAVLEPVLASGDKDASLMSLAGDVYMQNGNPQKADEYFSKAAALDPSSAARQTQVALAHLVEGKTDAAFSELEQISAKDTGTTADMALISSAIRTKDYARASKAIDALDKKRPNDPLVYSLRGTVLVAEGNIAAGRKAFEKALEFKASYLPAAAALATLDLKDGKSDEARGRFEKVLAADPKEYRASLALAEIMAKSGRKPEEVAGVIEKSIQASPGEPAPRLALINFYLQTKDVQKALTVAQDAATALPDRAEILDGLARVQAASGDANQALATCGRIVALMPGSPQPYLLMAQINVAAKDKAAAIKNLGKALDLKPDLLPAQRDLILLYVDAEKYTDALSVADEIKKQRPKEAVGYLYAGDIAAARKAWPEAVFAYRAGLQVAPTPELAVKTYAALDADGKHGDAEKFSSGWLKDHPGDAVFRLAMAEHATMQKDFAAAARHYQAVLQKQPRNPLVLNNLAWVLGQMKDPRAVQYAEEANRIAPNNPGIMETLGSLLAEKGELPRALDLLQSAVNLAPQAPGFRLSLARAQVKAGKRAEAQKNLDELSKLGDKFPGQGEVAKLSKEIKN